MAAQNKASRDKYSLASKVTVDDIRAYLDSDQARDLEKKDMHEAYIGRNLYDNKTNIKTNTNYR